MADQQSFTQLRAYDTNGNPVAGAKAYFYLTGTLTLTTVYADEALTIPHPSPLVADAGGGFAQVFANGSIKVNVTTSGGGVVPNYPIDPCWRSAGAISSAASVSFAPTTNIPTSDVQSAIVLVDTNSRTRDTSEAGLRAAADALLAPIASPTFTGVPAVPTATAGTNTTQAASTAFVTAAAMPIAIAGTGAGQFLYKFVGVSSSYILPSGGTWAYFYIRRSTSTSGITSSGGGIAAGGTNLFATGASEDALSWIWRIV